MLEYRAEVILWLLSNSVRIILMGVWIQAAQGGRFNLSPGGILEKTGLPSPTRWVSRVTHVRGQIAPVQRCPDNDS